MGGIKITNTQVMQLLRGPSGTMVKVTILRRSTGQTIDFTIKRGKIPDLQCRRRLHAEP